MSKNDINLYKNHSSDLTSYDYRKASATLPLANLDASKTSSKGADDKKAKDLVTKTLASISQPNAANGPYGTGDTVGSVGVAYKTFGQVNIQNGGAQFAGETTFLEARARTYTTKTGVGAEAQAGLFRTEYGGKVDAALAKSGDHELFGVGAQGKGELFIGVQANAQAGAGTKKGLPSASASVSAFAGARVVVTAGGEVRMLGLGLRAGGTASAWAGAQGSASASASPAGVSVEVEGFAGAEASATGTASFAGIGVTGEADAYAGAGGKAGITIGYKDGTITIDAELGGALGVGAGGEVGVGVNLDQLLGDGQEFLGTMGNILNDMGNTAGAVAGATANTAGDVAQDAAQAANDGAAAAAAAAQAAAQAAEQAAEQAVDAVANFFGF